MGAVTAHSGVDWVRTNIGHALTAEEARCVEVLCSLGAPYNLPLNWDRVEWRGRYVVVPRFDGELATFDGADLTRLCIAAHRLGVRVAVQAARGGNRASLRLMLHARDPEATRLMLRHPTADDLARMATRGQ